MDQMKIIIYSTNPDWEVEIPRNFAEICNIKIFLDSSEPVIRIPIPIPDYPKEIFEHVLAIYNIHAGFPEKEHYIEVFKDIKEKIRLMNHSDPNERKKLVGNNNIILARNEKNDKYVAAVYAYIMSLVPDNINNIELDIDEMNVAAEREKYKVLMQIANLVSSIGCTSLMHVVALIISNLVRDEITPAETFNLPKNKTEFVSIPGYTQVD